MFVQTQRIDYPDHSEEIAFLNKILDGLPKPFPDVCAGLVAQVLARLDQLMVASQARVSLYDPREDSRCS